MERGKRKNVPLYGSGGISSLGLSLLVPMKDFFTSLHFTSLHFTSLHFNPSLVQQYRNDPARMEAVFAMNALMVGPYIQHTWQIYWLFSVAVLKQLVFLPL
jgi:hypothetical protein